MKTRTKPIVIYREPESGKSFLPSFLVKQDQDLRIRALRLEEPDIEESQHLSQARLFSYIVLAAWPNKKRKPSGPKSNRRLEVDQGATGFYRTAEL